MYRVLTIFYLAISLMVSIPVLSQSQKSPTFSNDILIDDQADQDQRQVAICSAFNGWLYAGVAYTIDRIPWIKYFKSIDNGKTWSVIAGGLDGAYGDYTIKIDMIACGTDTSDLKLFIGRIKFGSYNGSRAATVTRYNCHTGEFEQSILGESNKAINDMALASDYMYPSQNANPYSIAAVYSMQVQKTTYTYRDTLIFRSSSNGGLSFDSRIPIAGTGNTIQKVALSYARSSTQSSGRYFVAWEQKEYPSMPFGNIYTSHSDPNFNSPFTTPYMLDQDPAFNNYLRNPSIACQAGDIDNDSANITSLVLCEHLNSAQQATEIVGFYNRTAASSINYNSSLITTGPHHMLQPDVIFNPYDHTFMATYFDSTDQKLPYITNNFNLTNPGSWNTLSSGYNDNANCISPYPKIRLSYKEHSGFCSWISDRSNGNGAAMFDAPFNYPSDIPNPSFSEGEVALRVYPNPVISKAVVEFLAEQKTDVEISIFDNFGRIVYKQMLMKCYSGEKMVVIDFSKYKSGMYMLRVVAGGRSINKKIFKE